MGCKQVDYITPKDETKFTVTWVKMDKKDICPDPLTPAVRQEPSKLGGNRVATRYKPKHDGASSFVGKVLEVISDPYENNALEWDDIYGNSI